MSVALIEPFDRFRNHPSTGSGTTRQNDCYTKCGGFDAKVKVFCGQKQMASIGPSEKVTVKVESSEIKFKYLWHSCTLQVAENETRCIQLSFSRMTGKLKAFWVEPDKRSELLLKLHKNDTRGFLAIIFLPILILLPIVIGLFLFASMH